MKIIIIGAGEVGQYLGARLSQEAHDVTIIEADPRKALKVDEETDVRVINGNGSAASILIQAQVAECQFFLAMTSDDRANLIACSLAKTLGGNITTIARVHDQTYADTSLVNYQLHFGIDILINPEALSAVELAKDIRNPGRVAVENFARGQIEVQLVPVSPKSKLIGRTLREIRLDPRLRIGFIQRADSIEMATADSTLQAGDLVTLFGHPEVLFENRPRFDPARRGDNIRVVIYGGTETAIALIRMLSNPRFRIRIIERDRDTCQSLAENFPNVTVIHGDATSLRLLEEEQIGSSDYFIACTKRDEDNIMTCLQASKLGAKHVQLMINKADYQDVLENLKSTLGFETLVSPRLATANEVLRYVSEDPYVEIASLPSGQARILDVKVTSAALQTGRKLRELQLPRGCVIVALLHKYQVRVPGANDLLLPGDRVVVVVREDRISELLQVLT